MKRIASRELSVQRLNTKAKLKREELRVNCGTRGVPDNVAPFRAWRGSRDLVAQSPKFHASAVALSRDCELSLAQRCCARSPLASTILRQDLDFAAGDASGAGTSDGFTQFTLNGPAPWICTMVSPLAIP